jgi:hypothetical protein
VIKPVREKSNLSIVPFDALKAASPGTHEKVVRGGAARFVRFGDKRLVFLDDTGSVHRTDVDLDDVAFTPELGPGDLLLLRGDMIHRTQDAETERVSASYRVANAETLVHRSRIARGGWVKARMMMKNPAVYERLFRVFDESGSDTLPFRELITRAIKMPASKEPQPREFFRLLMRQKLREGVLVHFLGTSISSLLADRLVAIDDFRRANRNRQPRAA